MTTLTYIACLGGVAFALYLLLTCRFRPTSSIAYHTLGPYPSLRKAQSVAGELLLRDGLSFKDFPQVLCEEATHISEEAYFVSYSLYLS